MKNIITFLFLLCNYALIAQTNTFPASGSVGIGTVTPSYKVQVDGGYVYSSAGFITPEYYWIGNGSVGYIRKLTSNIPLHFANSGGTSELTIAGDGKVGIGINTPSTSLELFSVDNTGTRVNPHNVLTITAENNNYPYSGFGGGIVFKNRTYNAGILTGARMRSVINYDGYQGQDYGTSLAFDVTPTINSSLTEAIRIKYNGNVGIGTTSPTEKLSVNGNIRAKKLIVTQQNWSDYVFYKGYKLLQLNEVEKFIQQYQHLPEVPSAKEVQANGISVGDTQALLLKKIEELTLYMIEQEKRFDQQALEIKKLKRGK